MNQPEKDANKKMYMHRQVTSKIGGGITYHFADPIHYGSTSTIMIRALGGVLLRAESGEQCRVDAVRHAPTDKQQNVSKTYIHHTSYMYCVNTTNQSIFT